MALITLGLTLGCGILGVVRGRENNIPSGDSYLLVSPNTVMDGVIGGIIGLLLGTVIELVL